MARSVYNTPMPTAHTTFQAALDDASHFLLLYGTTPPRADAAPERVERATARLAARTAGLALDGIIVYDVQDESGRASRPRPFPFLPTLEARAYAGLLQRATGRTALCYKSVAQVAEGDWETWLDAAHDSYGLRCLSLVGRAASAQQPGGGLPLSQAIRDAARHPAGFTLGGVVIPERHRPGHSESERLIAKAAAGCRYFVSQAVYAPEATISLLRDYARDCRASGLVPQRIVLTFTPCGGAGTLDFMKWLGIAIPIETERAILASDTPLTQSLRACASALSRILEAAGAEGVPLGVNVESVSIRKEEIEASVDLYHALRDVVGGA